MGSKQSNRYAVYTNGITRCVVQHGAACGAALEQSLPRPPSQIATLAALHLNVLQRERGGERRRERRRERKENVYVWGG